jgi:hypothetical protein
MMSLEDGYVAPEDVLAAVDTIARERGLRGNFAHLWEESIPFDVGEERRGSALAGVVLLAVSKSHSSSLEYASIDLISQETKRSGVSEQEVKRTVNALVAAGVLEERDHVSEKNYRIHVGLFHQWLRGIGRSELDSELEDVFGITEAEKGLRPSETEVAKIADCHWRRVDGRLIGTVEVVSWLAGFETLKRQRLAYKLLSAIKYYDEVEIRRKLTNLMEEVKARLVKVRYGHRNTPLNVFVTCGDDDQRSGSVVLRLLNQATGGTIRTGGATKMKEFLEEKAPEDYPRVVVLVNDFMGTGNAARSEIESVIAAAQRAGHSRDVIKIYYLAVTGFQSAVEQISSEFTSIKILLSDPLLDSDRAFSEENSYFSAQERVECQRMCEEIGRELVGDNFKLGYGNSQALVIFRHTVPNNTLSVLWASGTFRSKEWVPLFPRR